MKSSGNLRPRYSARQIADLLKRPTPTDEQIQVIEAALQPMLVVAGAGSGKTETMAARVVYLIANGLVRADQVLGLTFTKKAAGELAERIEQRLKQLAVALGEPGGGIWVDPANGSANQEPQDTRAAAIGRAERTGGAEMDSYAAMGDLATVATYNSFAASVVREYGLWVGVEPDSRLLSEASAWQLATELVASYAGDLNTEYTISSVADHILQLSGELAEHLKSPTDLAVFLSNITEHIASLAGRPLKEPNSRFLDSLVLRSKYLELVQGFIRSKRAGDYLTFSDQIALAAELAVKVPQVGLAYRARFKVVLLDEYQDTSHAQVTLLANLFGGGHPVTAVGDPNQAIYAWRGASASGLTRFPKDFPLTDGNPAPTYTLATTWRNDAKVLAAANQVAQPLRAATEKELVQVPELVLRFDAGQGALEAVVAESDNAEAEVIADWLAARWFDANLRQCWQPYQIEPSGVRTNTSANSQGASAPRPIEAAVLCRTRKQFRPISDALERRGVPVEVVGLGGLLDAPEVMDLVALLHVVADPTRGDWLLRLLRGPRINLGISDMHALGSWAHDLDKTHRTDKRGQQSGDLRIEAVVSPDETDARSLIAALAHLPPPDVKARDGRKLSAVGRERLQWLAGQLDALRKLTQLTLPEVCALAERTLGLDIEVRVVKAVGHGTAGRTNLDAFRAVATEFARNAETPDLASFLAWLDAAREQERGLDLPVQEVNKAAVQLITIHAAKGLEWDAVAVPGLVAGNFPSGRFSGGHLTDSAWLFDGGALPYELRGDNADLPSLNWRRVQDHKQLKEAIEGFTLASGQQELNNERRLAYVAFTRARHDLLLTASWWTGENKTPRKLAPFLTELAEAGLVASDEWAIEPAAGAENPAVGRQDVAIWPEPESDVIATLRAAAGQVRDAYQIRNATKKFLPTEPTNAGAAPNLISPRSPSGTNSWSFTGQPQQAGNSELPALVRLLLAERDADHPQAVQFPARISTSGLVKLARDRVEFTRQLRRPVPTQPSVQAHRGTRFHEWVQQHISPHGALFELDELMSADREFSDEAALAALKDKFLASTWATLQPIAIEQEIHTPLAGAMVIARIDAVYEDPEEPGYQLVVDWKTGPPAREAADRAAREVQLAIYRLAWSRYSGHPIEKVSAAFHHVATGETIRPARLLSEPELAAMIIGSKGLD